MSPTRLPPETEPIETVPLTEVTRPVLFRKMVSALAVLALVFLLAESGTRCLVFLTHAPQSYSVEFDQKYALAIHPKTPETKRVFMMGDSKMWHTYFPELLALRGNQQGVPYQSVNLSVNGSTPDMNLFLLKEAMAHNHRPALVIYNIAPIQLNRHFEGNPKLTAEGAFRASYMGTCLYQKSQVIEKKADCWLQDHSYFFRYRPYLAQTLSIMGEKYFLPDSEPQVPVLGAPKTEGSMGGWSPDYELFSDLDKRTLDPSFLNAVKSGESLTPFIWDPTPILRLRDYCIKNQIPLLLVWLPEHPSMAKLYRYFKVPDLKWFDTRMAGLANPDRQVGFLNLRTADTNPDHYYNADHLNILGGLTATESLSKLLLQPPYRELLKTSGSKPTVP